MNVLVRATTWLRRIVDVILVTVIVVVLAAVILGKLVPLTGRQSIVIGGASMEPAIGLGAVVVITPVDASELVVGDIVSLRVGEARTTFTHRIVTIVDRPDGRWIRTKGDANAEPDPTLVPASTVIGRVDLAVPLIGYLIVLLSAPIGVAFVLGLGVTLLAVAWLLESLEPSARDVAIPAATRPTDVGEVPPGRTALGPDPAALPPASPARRQIDRSRELRARRARWQMDHLRRGSSG
jgi:signal peptidase I